MRVNVRRIFHKTGYFRFSTQPFVIKARTQQVIIGCIMAVKTQLTNVMPQTMLEMTRVPSRAPIITNSFPSSLTTAKLKAFACFPSLCYWLFKSLDFAAFYVGRSLQNDESNTMCPFRCAPFAWRNSNLLGARYDTESFAAGTRETITGETGLISTLRSILSLFRSN